MQRIASLLNKLVDLQWRGLAVWIIWSLEVTRNEPVLFSLFFNLHCKSSVTYAKQFAG